MKPFIREKKQEVVVAKPTADALKVPPSSFSIAIELIPETGLATATLVAHVPYPEGATIHAGPFYPDSAEEQPYALSKQQEEAKVKAEEQRAAAQKAAEVPVNLTNIVWTSSDPELVVAPAGDGLTAALSFVTPVTVPVKGAIISVQAVIDNVLYNLAATGAVDVVVAKHVPGGYKIALGYKG